MSAWHMSARECQREKLEHPSISWGGTALSLATPTQNPHRKGRSMKAGRRLGRHIGTQARYWFPFGHLPVLPKKLDGLCSSSSKTDAVLGFGASPDSGGCKSNQCLKQFIKFIRTANKHVEGGGN